MADFDIYVQPLVEEARRRGISVRPIPELSAGYAVLEHDGHREYLCQSMSNRTGTVALRIAMNKAASLRLLDEAGLAVGRFRYTADVEDALAFLDRYERVVVKPADRSFGVGVRVGLEDEAALRKGFEEAVQHTRDKAGRVVVQEHLPGVDVRLLVVGGERVFGVERVPAWMEGDGETTIRSFVGDWNDRLEIANRRIRVTRSLVARLATQGLSLDDVPERGRRVVLGGLANAHQGGFSTDVTDTVCESARALALEAARCLHTTLLGVDVISPDITRTPGRIIEVNPHAGLTVHHRPTFGPPRDVAGAILDHLFPETAGGARAAGER